MTEAITDNLKSHQQEVERIRNNPDLSDEAKRRMIDEATARAAEESTRLQNEEREAIEEAVASAERKVLSIAFPERASASERAMIAMSYRDALDRAERAASDRDNPDALSELLDRAEKSGDDQLTRAIYHLATLRGNRVVAEAYLESRPKERQWWERYVEARREAQGLTSLLHRGLAHGLARRELGG
jgi:hypothetical protein